SHAASRSPGGPAGPGLAASHSVSSVVLPKPAGAETSTSFHEVPVPSRSLSRGRSTSARRDLGIYNFVSSSAIGTDQLLSHASPKNVPSWSKATGQYLRPGGTGSCHGGTAESGVWRI